LPVAFFVPEGMVSVEVPTPEHVVVLVVAYRPAIVVDESVEVSGGTRVPAIVVYIEERNATVWSMKLNCREIIITFEVYLTPVIGV
jgi:hypothetical protein